MMKACKAALLALAAVLAACSEGSVAPTAQQAPNGPAAVGGGSTQSLTSSDTLRFSFVIDPSQNMWYYLGAGNSISFPAHSLCNPASSTYGPGQWDAPCSPATAPVTISAAAWIDKTGHPRVDFSPHIRFVPTSNPAGWVNLTFTDYAAAQGWLSILYCPDAHSTTCFDEALSDPTLATFRDPTTGHLTRRIKHFSGYNVGAGGDSTSDGGGSLGGMDRMPARGAALSGVAARTQTAGLLRQSPVAAGQSVSAVIGPWGGVLNLNSAGFSLIVPPGAVAASTRITVTAVAGRLVAYDFEPHGTRFNLPLLFVQDLRGTQAPAFFSGSIYGAYFADDSQLDEGAGVAVVDELLNAAVNPFTRYAMFPIWHFSGYMLALG